jgi:anti-sigma factor RsiW
MSGMHPSEEKLQQFVLDRPACTEEQIIHIEGCPDCRASVAAYRTLADALKAQPAPAFDFDLAASVIGQLEMPPGRKRTKGSWLTAVLVASFIGIPAWLFRRSAYFVFTDMSAVFYWILLAATGIVVGTFLLRLYRQYQHVINLLNK